MEHTLGTRNIPVATKFIQISVPLYPSGIVLRNAIEIQLQTYGEPLRWAITAVDSGEVQVEAVVTIASVAHD